MLTRSFPQEGVAVDIGRTCVTHPKTELGIRVKEERANLAAGISMGQSHEKSGRCRLGVLHNQYSGPDVF